MFIEMGPRSEEAIYLGREEGGRGAGGRGKAADKYGARRKRGLHWPNHGRSARGGQAGGGWGEEGRCRPLSPGVCLVVVWIWGRNMGVLAWRLPISPTLSLPAMTFNTQKKLASTAVDASC